MKSDMFTLFNLRVTTSCRPGTQLVCNHPEGSYFDVVGENIIFPPGQTFPLYSLAALLPLLPAKQRVTHPHDWMTTDMEIACPDPHCGGLFRIERTGTTDFSHAEVTVVPLQKKKEKHQ